jgi:hypothetical protein
LRWCVSGSPTASGPHPARRGGGGGGAPPPPPSHKWNMSGGRSLRLTEWCCKHNKWHIYKFKYIFLSIWDALSFPCSPVATFLSRLCCHGRPVMTVLAMAVSLTPSCQFSIAVENFPGYIVMAAFHWSSVVHPVRFWAGSGSDLSAQTRPDPDSDPT